MTNLALCVTRCCQSVLLEVSRFISDYWQPKNLGGVECPDCQMTRWISCCSKQAVWSELKASSRTLWHEAADQEPRGREIQAPRRKGEAPRTVADCSSLWVFWSLSNIASLNDENFVSHSLPYHWNLLARRRCLLVCLIDCPLLQSAANNLLWQWWQNNCDFVIILIRWHCNNMPIVYLWHVIWYALYVHCCKV